MKMTSSIKLTAVALTATFGLAAAATAAERRHTAAGLDQTGRDLRHRHQSHSGRLLREMPQRRQAQGQAQAGQPRRRAQGRQGRPILTPGDSANSFVVKSTAHLTADHDSWMPPLNNRAGIKPLTPDQIGLIRAWIDQGAK